MAKTYKSHHSMRRGCIYCSKFHTSAEHKRHTLSEGQIHKKTKKTKKKVGHHKKAVHKKAAHKKDR